MQYPKPDGFSDPHQDWEGCGDLFRQILDKRDEDLTTDDYRVIFAQHLPAADYAEGAYYIDKCIAHIAGGREVHASRLPEGFLWWLAHFRERLEQDQAFGQIKESLVSAVWENLDRFELFDLTEEECKSIGRSFMYSVSPYNSSTVNDFFDEITIYDDFEPELERMVGDLVSSDRIEHVRWYVQIAFHTRSWCTVFNVDDYGLDNYPRKEDLFHRLHSFGVLQRKQEAAMMATFQEDKVKYNRLVRL
jgi:hypothetical protein